MKKIGTSVSVVMLIAICLFGMLQLGFQAPETMQYCCDANGYYGMTVSPSTCENMYVSKETFGSPTGNYFTCQQCADWWNGGTYDCSNCENFANSGGWRCYDTYAHDVIYCEDYPPVLSITENSTDFGTATNTISNCFTVANVRGNTLEYDISKDVYWITNISPDQGDLTAGGDESDNISVTVDRSNFSQAELANSYNDATIDIDSNGGDDEVTIRVHVAAPAAPTTLDVSNRGSWGSNIHLTWNNVASEVGYRISRRLGSSGDYSVIATVGVNVTGYTDTEYTVEKNGSVIWYRVESYNGGGYSPDYTSILGEGNTARMGGPDLMMTQNLPESYSLDDSFPNPGNPGTSITFQMPEAGNAVLKVVNIRGAVVRTLVNEQRSAGSHQVHWDGKNDQGLSVGSGMYIFILNAGGKTFNKKYSLVK